MTAWAGRKSKPIIGRFIVAPAVQLEWPGHEGDSLLRRGHAPLRYLKAVAKIVDDTETLLAFFDLPAEHWIHLKTTNSIESAFATVRLRTKVTKGPGSRAAGLAMAFKLIKAAEQRWRSVNAPNLVALVRGGAKFDKGVMIQRPSQQDQEAVA